MRVIVRGLSLLLVTCFCLGAKETAQAQLVVPASDHTVTIVTPEGNRFDISGGQLSGDGVNLFHSFTQFGLNQNQIANFLSSPNIHNILARVVGGDVSVINGWLQVTGGNSNLFLLNPAGIIFGPSASLNLPAAFTATTADAIGFGGGWFYAAGPNNYGTLIGPPVSFVSTMSHPGTIINSGNLTVSQGQALSLLGGTVVSTGSLTAPEGQIMVATLPGESLVRLQQSGSLLSLDIQPLSGSQSPIWNLAIASLPQLLTAGGGGNATGLTIKDNGVVELTGSNLTVASGDVVVRNVTASTATLAAEQNVTLFESQLRTTGDLNILAKDTVRVRDSLVTPFLAHTGGHLYIQGNQAIDILALNHLEITPFVSGGNLSLVSHGIISGDAHFSSGGSFAILNLNGQPGIFISLYDPIISSEGDVIFGDYTGVALKVESKGSIFGGNIVITGPDTSLSGSDPDIAILTSSPALILRAGVATLSNPANLPPTQTSGSTSFTTSGPSLPGSITVGDIDTSVSSGQAGPVTLTAPGEIQTGIIRASALGNTGIANQGGNVTITAGGNITIAGIGTRAGNSILSNSAGDVAITTSQDVVIGVIGASAFGPTSLNNQGGNVAITAIGDITFDVVTTRATEALLSNIAGDVVIATTQGVVRGVSSISGRTISTEAIGNGRVDGTILIQQGGGPNNLAFTVGDATNNGTAGALAGGDTLISPITTFATPGTTTQAGISVTFVNTPPTLTPNPVILEASEGDTFTFTYDELALQVVDVDGDLTGIVIDTIADTGVLTRNGIVVEPGTQLSPGDVLVYTPVIPGLTSSSAFSVKATDGISTSTSVPVNINTLTAEDIQSIDNDLVESSNDITNNSVEDANGLTSEAGESITTPPDPSNVSGTAVETELELTKAEETFSADFTDYFKLGNEAPVKTLMSSRDVLRQIRGVTGIKPALVYARFVPVALKAAVDSKQAQQFNPLNPEKIATLQQGDPRAKLAKLPSPTSQQAQLLEKDSDQLELVLVTAEGEAVRKRVPEATRGQVLAVARQFREQTANPNNNEYLASAQQLYGWLIAPLEATLTPQAINNLTFIADTGLRSLPFAALHNGEQFLVEKYSIGIMPSLSLTDTQYVDIRKAQVLAMGASEFTDQYPLPAVPEELAVITKALWPGRAFLNQSFTLENLRTQRRQQQFRILHLATHSEFRPGTPNNSFIQFWDTKLQLDQLRQLQLNDPPVELLVLSACRTALGDRQAELGFAGLAVQAGVKSVLGSLWYVSDEGTLGLMVEFYRNLKTAPIKAEALRQAQLTMLKGQVRVEKGRLKGSIREIPLPPELADTEDQILSHPYYWAAFTMLGNPW